MKTSFNLLTGKANKHLIEWEEHLIHEEVLPYFLKLKSLAKSEANIDLSIVSSFRCYQRQEIIWNNKVIGERKVFDDHENEVHMENLSDREKVNAITRFSAIPGASRHHWGTDIDIFDQAQLKKGDVKLHPSEYSDTGCFSKLTSWLSEKIACNQSFGFYRPYESDLGGIHPEAWHLSFAPLSRIFEESYNIDTFTKNLEKSEFFLRDFLLENSSEYFKKLLLNVTPAPQM